MLRNKFAPETKKLEEEILRRIIKETFWMARRYAHSRQTGSPSTVRECYRLLEKYFPELLPDDDIVIEANKFEGSGMREDYLNDCNNARITKLENGK